MSTRPKRFAVGFQRRTRLKKLTHNGIELAAVPDWPQVCALLQFRQSTQMRLAPQVTYRRAVVERTRVAKLAAPPVRYPRRSNGSRLDGKAFR